MTSGLAAEMGELEEEEVEEGVVRETGIIGTNVSAQLYVCTYWANELIDITDHAIFLDSLVVLDVGYTSA